jgi:hypothetical protein
MIVAPAKVFVPAVVTRMKEGNFATGCRIERVSFIGLGTVTSLTGQGQIVLIVRAA